MSRTRTRPATQIQNLAKDALISLNAGSVPDELRETLTLVRSKLLDIIIISANINAATGRNDGRRRKVTRVPTATKRRAKKDKQLTAL